MTDDKDSTSDPNSQATFDKAMALFEQALDRPAEERGAYVKAESRDDAALEREVASLLEAHEDGASLPPVPVMTSVAPAAMSSAESEPASYSIPEKIGHYRILEKIAEGGMGAVYLAEQREPMRRRAAVKLLKPGMDSREVITRFEAERQALALMDHPNIAKVYDGGVSDSGRPYFAMEYVPGEPLTEYCDQQRLSLAERLRLYVKVCSAVQHAHQKGIIHRDLKPSNVLVTSGDGSPEPKVIDFGIAKAVGARLTEETLFTAHGLLVGTPEYMSPEQAQGGMLDVDTRSDVYSLGVLLYEVLVGRLPFERDSLRRAGFAEALRILREDEPPRPSTRLQSLAAEERKNIAHERKSTEVQMRRVLDRDLDWVILRALEKDRNRRYPSASELAADLERYLADEPVSAGPPSVRYRMGKFVRRHRFGVVAAAVLASVLLVSGITLTVQAQRLRMALDRAQLQTERAETVSGFLLDAFRESDPTSRRVDREVTAREVLEQSASKIEEQALSPDVRAELSSTMAVAFLGLGNIESAEPLANAAVEAAEEVGGAPLVRALAVQSGVLRRQSKFDDALQRIERSLALLDQESLPARLGIEARQEKVLVLNELGRFDEAERTLEQAEAMARSLEGDDRQLATRLLLRRAGIANLQARYNEALEMAQQALGEIDGSSENPILDLQARQSIATSLNELGRIAEALEWDEESLKIATDRLGLEHDITRSLRNNYGMKLNYIGRYEEALETFNNSVAISRKLDPTGTTITYELNNLGLVQQGMGRLDDAEATFREALELQYAVVGHDHPNPGYHLMNLARALQEGRRYGESEQKYQAALELWKRLLPEGHTLIGNVDIWYGALLVETGRASEGRPLIEQGVEVRIRDRGEQDWQTAEAQSWLGAALAELGEHERAEELLVQAYQPIFDQRGPEWRRCQWAHRRVLAFYDLVGNREAFTLWAERFQQNYGETAVIDPAHRWSAK